MIVHRTLCEYLFRQVNRTKKELLMEDVARYVHTAEVTIYKRLKGRVPEQFTVTRTTSESSVSVNGFLNNMEYPFIDVRIGSEADMEVPDDVLALQPLSYCKLEEYFSQLSYCYFQVNGRVFFKPATGSTYFIIGYQKPVVPFWSVAGSLTATNKILVPDDEMNFVGNVAGAMVVSLADKYQNVFYVNSAGWDGSVFAIITDRNLEGSSGAWSDSQFSSVSVIPDEYEVVIHSMVLSMFGIENKGMADIAGMIAADTNKPTGRMMNRHPMERF